jgi:D-alanyl-D-alanine carboxypeptidase (penicillin-binding protein 5/6)
VVVCVTPHAGWALSDRSRQDPGAAIVVDVRTGRVLSSRAAHRRMAPASTTKIMTALLVLERMPPDAVVTVGRAAAAMRNGSTIGLVEGERWPVDDLLRALLLSSANDAAVALAEAVAGSAPRLAALMNARARRIGARATHFVNPHGLDAPDHYTTAYDLALIARHALLDQRFAALVRAPNWTLDRPGRPRESLPNRNRLLSLYEGADGVKTGMTAAAGSVLVGSATRGGWQLLVVVLKSQDMYGVAVRLLDDGFARFVPVTAAVGGRPLATMTLGDPPRTVAAAPTADVHAVVRRGYAVSQRVTWRLDLRLPIAAGARVGEVRFFDGPELVARATLVAAHPVAR